MNDQQPDPSATFRADQEAAQAEQATREETQWGLHVRDHDAQVAMKMAAAANEQAKAELRDSITLTIYVAASMGSVWAIVQGVQAVIGWVR